jgi:hypothetical protein
MGEQRDIEFHKFLTLALDESGWSASYTGRLIPSPNPKLGGLQSWVWMLGGMTKISVNARNQTQSP